MSALARKTTFGVLVGVDALLAALLAAQFWGLWTYRRSIAAPRRADTLADAGSKGNVARPDISSYKVIGERALFGGVPKGASSAKSRSPFTLKGVLGDKVILCSEATGKEELVEMGGTFEGAKLKSIGLDRVVLERDGKLEELKLFVPKPGGDQPRGPEAGPGPPRTRPSDPRRPPGKTPPRHPQGAAK